MKPKSKQSSGVTFSCRDTCRVQCHGRSVWCNVWFIKWIHIPYEPNMVDLWYSANKNFQFFPNVWQVNNNLKKHISTEYIGRWWPVRRLWFWWLDSQREIARDKKLGLSHVLHRGVPGSFQGMWSKTSPKKSDVQGINKSIQMYKTCTNNHFLYRFSLVWCQPYSLYLDDASIRIDESPFWVGSASEVAHWNTDFFLHFVAACLMSSQKLYPKWIRINMKWIPIQSQQDVLPRVRW